MSEDDVDGEKKINNWSRVQWSENGHDAEMKVWINWKTAKSTQNTTEQKRL